MPVVFAFRSAITLPMSAVAPLPPKHMMPWKEVAQPIIDAVNESLENTGWSAVGRLRVTSDKRRSRAGHEASSRLGLSRHPSASGHRPPTGVGHVHDAIQIPIGLQPGLLVAEGLGLRRPTQPMKWISSIRGYVPWGSDGGVGIRIRIGVMVRIGVRVDRSQGSVY